MRQHKKSVDAADRWQENYALIKRSFVVWFKGTLGMAEDCADRKIPE